MNSFEAFAPFAAAVLIAHLGGGAPSTAATLAIVFCVARAAYIALYIANLATFRSLVWGVGFFCTCGLFRPLSRMRKVLTIAPALRAMTFPHSFNPPQLEGALVGDKYRVQQLIGSGGMGTVWLGMHEALGTRVAIKFIARSTRACPTRVSASRSRRAPPRS